jgi:ubiquinone/menaquinone biosynthesis C-methylase UbiE
VREEQLQILVALIKGTFKLGQTILDLGCGSGIVEESVLREILGVQIVGVDFSEVMLEIASRRLNHWLAQLQWVNADFNEIESLELPRTPFHIVISVQALHNVSHNLKKRIFARVYSLLDPTGVFYILDRIAVTPDLFDQIRLVWDRLEAVHQTRINEGLSYAQHAQSLNENGDDPASLEEHRVWLKNAGFHATCVHLHANRALIVARKV